MKSSLLVASPHLDDAMFERTVILLCEYGEEGAMGLVINRPLSLMVEAVLTEMGMEADGTSSTPVGWGGPLKPRVGFLVCRGGDPGDDLTLSVTDRVYLATSRNALEKVVQTTSGIDYQLVLGCAAWDRHQLDGEILEGTWLVLDHDESVLFDVPFEDRWEHCIQSLQVTEEQLWMHPVEE